MKQNGVYQYEYMDSFKKILMKNYLISENLLGLQIMNALVKKTIHILSMFGINFKWIQWVIIMILF